MLSLKDIHTTEEPKDIQTIMEPQDIKDTTEELQDVHTTDGSKKVPKDAKEKLKRTKIKNAQEMQANSSLKETDRVSKETEE